MTIDEIPVPKGGDRLDAAKVVAVIGGIFGIFLGVISIYAGRGQPMDLQLTDPAAMPAITTFVAGEAPGLLAMVLGLAGIIGGLLLDKYPRASILAMLVAGVGGFFAITLFWILPGMMLIFAAILAWREQTAGEPLPA